MKKVIFSLALVGLGTFAMAQQKEEVKKFDRAQMEKMQQAKFDELKKDLNLTESQVAQIKALKEQDKAERMKAFEASKVERAQKMEEMKAKRAKHDAEMKKILTPEQYAKWEAKKAEMNSKNAQHKFSPADRAVMKKRVDSDKASK